MMQSIVAPDDFSLASTDETSSRSIFCWSSKSRIKPERKMIPPASQMTSLNEIAKCEVSESKTKDIQISRKNTITRSLNRMNPFRANDTKSCVSLNLKSRDSEEGYDTSSEFSISNEELNESGIVFENACVSKLRRLSTDSMDSISSRHTAVINIESLGSSPKASPSIPSKPSSSNLVTQSQTLNWHDIASPTLLGRLSAPEIKRQDIIYEMIQTEKDFVHDMQMIMSLFIHPLKKTKILSKKDLNTVFSNLEALVPINESLLNELESRVDKELLAFCVGDIYANTADFFKIYTQYCTNYTSALIFLEKSKNKEFQQFVNQAEKDPRMKSLNLSSYLIKPVQRICKYPLLLKSLLSCTDSTSPDKLQLDQALVKINQVVLKVNEDSKHAENSLRMVEIIRSFQPPLDILTPSLVLVKETSTPMNLIDENGVAKRTCWLFLFNSLLVVATKKRDKKFTIILEAKLKDLLIISPSRNKSVNLFQFIYAGKFRYVFSTTSITERDDFIKHLNIQLRESRCAKNIKSYEANKTHPQTHKKSTNTSKQWNKDTISKKPSSIVKLGNVELEVVNSKNKLWKTKSSESRSISLRNRFRSLFKLFFRQPKPKEPELNEAQRALSSLKKLQDSPSNSRPNSFFNSKSSSPSLSRPNSVTELYSLKEKQTINCDILSYDNSLVKHRERLKKVS